MNVNRAQQIVESTKEIEVLYHGDPVWIENIDEEEHTARVYTSDEPDREMDVPVKELQED